MLMPIRQLVDIIQTHREIVVCDTTASMNAHQSLYHLTDDAYITLPEELDRFTSLSGLICECSDNSLCVEFHMHVVLQWGSLLKVAAWKETLTWSDVFFLLKDAGVSSSEMQPFRDSNPEDLFPWLYYGKKMDVLRRLCLRAKRKFDEILSLHDIRVLCHLVGDDPQRIVASSL